MTVEIKVARQLARAALRTEDPQLSLADGMVLMRGDDLEKVLEEIIDNALKFSSPATLIKITGTVHRSQYTLKILNQGRGMQPEEIHSIGAYAQIEFKLHEQQGSGLGLAIAQDIAALYKGTLTINGTPSDVAKFTVVLPLHP